MLFVSDLVALALALFLGLDLGRLAKLAGTPPVLSLWMQDTTSSHFISFFSAVVLMLFWFWSEGHYSKRLPFWEELGQTVKILYTGLATEIGLLYLLSHAGIDWRMLLTSWLAAFLAVPIGRMAAKHALLFFGLWRRDAIIVGLGMNGLSAYAALRSEPLMGYEVRWFGRCPGESFVAGEAIVTDSRDVTLVDLSMNPATVLDELENPQVVVALDSIRGQESFILELGAGRRDVLVVPSIRGLPLYGAEVSHFFSRELLMLRVRNNLASRSSRFVKRTFDIVGASLLVLLLMPLFLTLIVLIRRDGGNAVYGHSRIGTGERTFKCLKFRTMVINADKVLKDLLDRDADARAEWDKVFKLKNDPRVTRVGAFLRRYSLDELPQLINVLKGEMSLVGPRPVVQEELQRYGDQVGYYLQVRPGITGLWQVSGRNDVDYATRVSLDAWYVKNWSIWTDIVILLKTWQAVTHRTGAY